MSEQTLTHKDLAGLLGVSETTVKSYRRKFPGCIPVASRGKPIRFAPEAARVAARIRELFETGMSVDEVRLRLAAEFDFISPAPPQAAAAKESGRAAERAELAPELSAGVSNMAKSLVAMTQQQKAILSRMQGVEGLLEDLGLKGEKQGGPEGLGAALSKKAEEARRREELLEARLNRLDDNTRELAETVQDLAGQLERFLSRRETAAAAWQGSAPATLAAAAKLAAETGVRPFPAQEEGRSADAGQPARAPQAAAPTAADTAPGTAGARVIPMRPESGGGRASPPQAGMARHTQEQQRTAVFGEAQDEPQRQFFSLPLVVRTEQGAYVSAGGRSRGPFSLNDLKAMLIYGFTPPNHFTLSWNRHGQGWWLCLEQEKSERSIHLLLMELPAQRGGSVAEILQIKQDGNTLHPAEICGIIDSFGI